jgi:anti-sigma B factor antagonist
VFPASTAAGAALAFAMRMQVAKTTTDDAVRFRISGDLDALSAESIRSPFRDALRDGVERVELDLSELELIDSSGAGAIVWMYKQLRQRGATLAIVGLHGQPRAIFRLLGLDRVFLVEQVA